MLWVLLELPLCFICFTEKYEKLTPNYHQICTSVNTLTAIDDFSRFYRSLPSTTLVVQ